VIESLVDIVLVVANCLFGLESVPRSGMDYHPQRAERVLIAIW
jgi:hypothetical protein